MATSDLEKQFHQAMLNLYQESQRAIGYRPTYMLQMVNEQGGLAAARSLLAKQDHSSGLTTLWEKQRLDLSVEALVLKPEYATLFTDQEREQARKFLKDFNYTAPWDKPVGQNEAVPGLVTGAEAGLSANEQLRIALHTMAANNGVATMQQIYEVIESQLNGRKLSSQGKATLRSYINRDAVSNGYVAPYDEDKPGWWITEAGRDFLNSVTNDTGNSQTNSEDTRVTQPNQITRGQILNAMETFDQNIRAERPQTGISSWENNYEYFINYAGQLYPVKRIIQMASNNTISSTSVSRRILAEAGFEIVYKPHSITLGVDEEIITWPKLDGPAFVVIHKYENEDQELGKTYIFNQQASGDTAKLAAAVRVQQSGGSPVYLIIYRPGPEYSFVAWARVNRVSGDYQSQYKLGLDYHAFPNPLNLKGNAATLLSKISWLGNGLKPAFNYRAIREIAANDFEAIIMAAKDGDGDDLLNNAYSILAAAEGNLLDLDEIIRRLRESNQYPKNLNAQEFANRLRNDNRFMEAGDSKWMIRPPAPPIFLPAAWPRLADYWAFVRRLDNTEYTAEDLFARAENLAAGVDALELATNLCQLRLLRLKLPEANQETTTPVYVRQSYTLAQVANQEAILRLMALGFLLPAEKEPDSYELLARRTLPWLQTHAGPFIGGVAPELGGEEEKLLGWYAEARLLVEGEGGWLVTEDALEPLAGRDTATTTCNDFLQALQEGLAGKAGLDPISGNPTLQPLTENELDSRLAELKRDLIIDEMVVRRIYRSLLAGRHVVLSGPPGTGKTELARRLPELLWRIEREVRQVTTNLSDTPSTTTKLQRNGYKPMVVTATEDWGVSDVIGGIRPRLNQNGQNISYAIHYGHLTRAILKNYDGLDRVENLPAQLPTLQRSEYSEDGKSYKGVWLVIDEFTRAPIDAAFGSLLTTLSGSKEAHLAVPTGEGGEIAVRVPADFRIIGTLNSFDRHFLNQMSEALKRRFDFIDVLPPTSELADEEQRIARQNALKKLEAGAVLNVAAGGDIQSLIGDENSHKKDWRLDGWEGSPIPGQVNAALVSFWRIFMLIRLFRQFGTAQAEATYLNLFSGVIAAGMDWSQALDSALADTLADQLQVLGRDEQRILLTYLKYAQDTTAFANELNNNILGKGKMPPNRRMALLHLLNEADELRNQEKANKEPIPTDEKGNLSQAQIERLFDTGEPLALPPLSRSIFYARLNSLANERGL